MKSIRPILLGTLAGAVMLPLAMFACASVVHFLLPRYFGPFSINTLGVGICVAFSTLLGAGSAMLWCGKRTLWPRLGSAICALVAISPFVWALKEDYYRYSVLKTGLTTGNWFATEVVFAASPLILASAILFFAILMRPRNTAK